MWEDIDQQIVGGLTERTYDDGPRMRAERAAMRNDRCCLLNLNRYTYPLSILIVEEDHRSASHRQLLYLVLLEVSTLPGSS